MPVFCAAAARAVTEIWAFRDLLWSLTWRDVRVRYKQSLLGVAWAVLLPISMMLIFTFVFTRALQSPTVSSLGIPYALYVYTGLVPWTFLAAGLNGCVQSLVANRNLVTKVYFPREVFPLSAIAAAFVDFCIASVVMAGLMAFFSWHGSWQPVFAPAMLLVPIVLLIQILLTVGLGMLLAMANLFYRDVRQLFSVAIQLAMFLSAVVVPVPTDGLLAGLLRLNPVVALIEAYRACLIEAASPNLGGLAYAAAFAALILVAGWIGFRRASFRFAECI